MSALFDTHIFVWWVTEPERLSPAQMQMIENRDASAFVSAVIGWEIAIKVRLGKWPNAAPLLPDLAGLARRSGLQLLDITMAQAERAGSLPLIHKDPFDRLLAAQALELDIPILTVDPVFGGFGCKVV